MNTSTPSAGVFGLPAGTALAPADTLSGPGNIRVVLYTGTQQVHAPLSEILKFVQPPPTPDPDPDPDPEPVISIPAGMIAPFAMETPPEGWLECDGREVSREDYINLFTAIGTIWGDGDGQATFNLPDFQGQFLRGWPGGGLDPERAFASKQKDAIRNIEGIFGRPVNSGKDNNYATIYERSNTQGAFFDTAVNSANPVFRNLNSISTTTISGSFYPLAFGFDASRVVPVADENRPVNTSILYCIKT